jgi:peptide/nickel transport system permease protein
MRLLPGDPILLYLSEDEFGTISAEQIEILRHKFGLDKTLLSQYFHWFSGLMHGDLGKSILQNNTVSGELGAALPITLHIGILSWLFSHLIGIPIGILCAVRRGKWVDTILTVFANIGITAPIFWVGILLIYLFGLYLGWLPIYGYTSPLDDFWMSTKQILMPVFCLCLFPLSATVRQTRSAMLEVIGQDYIRTAWAKGLRERVVILRHALKNGIIPVVTLAAIGISHIAGGQVLIETVFAIPGMGWLAVNALFSRDFAVVQGVVLITAGVVVVSNIIVDIFYGWLDPRIRFG